MDYDSLDQRLTASPAAAWRQWTNENNSTSNSPTVKPATVRAHAPGKSSANVLPIPTSDDELDLQKGNSVSQIAFRISNALGTLAPVDFDRARAASDRLRLPELRLRAYLEIEQQTLQLR